MYGTSRIFGGGVGPNPGADWHVVGAGQFNNGDTKSDILWQHDNGTPAVWTLNELTLTSAQAFANPGAAWHLIA
jgi:hypothetical protein